MDVQTRVEDTTALAAYVQCLVKLLVDQFEAGEPVPIFHRILMSENKWLAARYGLDAPLMDLAAGKRMKVRGAARSPSDGCANSSPWRRSSAAPRSWRGWSGSSKTDRVHTASCRSTTPTATWSK